MLTLIPSDGHSAVIVVAHDHVSLADVKTTLRMIPRHHCEMGVIWDMRQAELGELHCRDIKDVVASISALLPNNDTYRVAILGNDPLHYGLFRTFQTYVEFAGLKRDYGYFTTLIEASEWISAYVTLRNSGLPWPTTTLTELTA